MPVFFLESFDQNDLALADRLRQLISIVPIKLSLVEQQINKGDILFTSGVVFDGIEATKRGNFLEGVLRNGIHVVVHPPFPLSILDWRIPFIEEATFQTIEYSPVKIVNESFEEIVGNRDFNILFNLGIVTGPGRPFATSSRGISVAHSFHYRSSWGVLICTTLLFGSTSIRSPRVERSAFLQSLVKWLESHNSSIPIVITKGQEKALYSDFDLSILLIGLFLFNQEGEVDKLTLLQKVQWIQNILQIQKTNFPLEEVISELKPRIITAEKDSILAVNVDQLVHEINRRHLWSYLRRMK